MLVTSAHSNIFKGDISMDIYSISAKLNLIFDIESSNISNELLLERPNDLDHSIPSAMLGHTHTEESKHKISASHMGMKKPWAKIKTEEFKRKLSNTLTGKKRINVNWNTVKLSGNNRTEKQKLASQKHSQKMLGRKAHNKKQVTFRNITFESVREAIKYFNISTATYYKEICVQ